MELTQIKKVQSTDDQHNNDFDKHAAMASERNDDKEMHSHENAHKDSLKNTSKKNDITDHEGNSVAKIGFEEGTNKDAKKVEDEDNAEGPTEHCNRNLARSGDASREQKNDIKEQPFQEDKEQMTKKDSGTLDSQRFMSVQNFNVDGITQKERELESPESKSEGDASEGCFGSQGAIGKHKYAASGAGRLGNDQQLQGNTDKDVEKSATASPDYVVNGINRMEEEQKPQKTRDKDNVKKHTDSGSQKNKDAEYDVASKRPGDDSTGDDANGDDATGDDANGDVATVESALEYDNDDLMKFAVILGGNHAIIAPQGEEALKWRFLFDCPYTQKEICKDPIMVGTSLEYRKGTLPLICWKKSERSFKKRLEELLQKHAKQVQICNTVIPNEAVNIFLEAQELVELFQSKMVIAYKSETNLYICGKKEHMKEAIRHVNNAKDYALRSISKTETISLKDIPLQLIKRWLEVHMSTDTSNIQYEFREDQECLHITGIERVIKQEKDKLLNLLGNITHTRCKSRLCVAHFSAFEQSGVVKYIERILQEQKLVCTWETNKADCIIVTVTAFDKETCKMACKVIDAACVSEGISLQMDAVTKILPSDSWKQELSSLCTKFDGKMTMLLDQDTNILEYVCTPDIRAMVRHEVQGLVNNWDREKHLLIEKQVADKLQKEKQKLRKLEDYCNVIISVSRKIEKMGLLIVGKDINIQLALEKLEKEFNLILKPQPKPAMSWHSLENCECIYVPETNEAEVIILKDECLLKSNKNNEAELKDMRMDTEIVEITPVFSLKVNQPDEVEADMVLPVDKSKRPVIFFCPNWNEGHLKDRHILDVVLCHLFEFLSSLDGDALLEIEDKKIGNWPVMEFVKQMLITFQTFLKANAVTKMTHLLLLIKNEEVYDIVSAAASDVYSANKLHAEEEATVMSKASQISCGTKALEVFVVNDQLTHRKEDVLVNTADPELKLCFGYVSKSIYDAAGEGIRIECKSRYPNGIKPGQVAVTGAYRLSGSKLIFHGTFEKWNPKMEKKLKHTLKDFVTQCLQKADKAKMNSIAFPAIGTGILNYPSVLVADCMFEAVEDYTQTKPVFLHKVYFVIYNKDQTNVEAFGERKKLHDKKIEGPPVDQQSTFASGGAKSKRKPIEQQNHSMNETSQPGSSKEGRLFDTGDCLTNSRVRIRPGVMAKFKQGKTEQLEEQFNIKTDFNTGYIKGKLEDLQTAEIHLQNLIGGHLDDKPLSNTHEMKEEKEESEHEYHNLSKKLVADNISEVKYEAFKYFFHDLYVSTLQKNVHFSFDPKNGKFYVQGQNEEAVAHAIGDIRKAEIAKLQESEACITSEQLQNAQKFVMKMKRSSSDNNVFCHIDENNPLIVHFVAKTVSEINIAKHMMNIDLGIPDLPNRIFDDKNGNVQLASVPLKMSPQEPCKKSFTTAEGIKVFVYKCPIQQAQVDVIVNAANEDLKHTVGVAKVIADEAGKEFTEECQRYIMENGNLEVGTACITSGGNPKYPFVIHTVGPKWDKYSKTSEGVQNCMDDLRKSVISCFMKAAELQVQSVALPAIGSGMLFVPMEICAGQYLKAVMEYSKSTQGTGSLKEIHFVDVKDEIINLIELVFSAALENNQAASKEFNDRLQKVLSSCQDPSTQQIFASFASLENIVPSSNEQKCMVHFTEIFKVLIYTGDITDSQCKAIVSSDVKQLKSDGGLVEAIWTKAGKDCQRNIVSHRERDYEVGDVLEFDAGKMKSKVICCIFPKWTSSKPDEEYQRHVGQCFKNILEKARAYESVAIPLTGIGFKDDSITVCGRILLDCLLKFSKAHREKEAIREVHIVSLDDEAIACMVRIFKEHFDAEKKKLNAGNGNSAYLGEVSATASGGHEKPSQKSHVQSRGMRQVSKSEEHSETRREAEMDIMEKVMSYNTESIHPPGAQTMNRSEDDKQDHCVICLDNFEIPVEMKRCGHMFCKGCIDTHLKNKPVCPVCGTIYGVITGNQPKGRMTECVHKDFHLDGYKECGMITITYDIPDGIQGKDHPKPGQHYSGLRRMAYLPNNAKGQKVLHLLHLAFDRQLIFTIGRSVTTGLDDVVTWNDIHHKTSMHGGPQNYGYPDPTYLDRVLEELAAKGVTEESEHHVPGNFSDYYKLTPVKESTV